MRNDCLPGIPMPIVSLNRWTIVLCVIAALLLRQPLITTVLFALILPAALFGSRGSLIYWVGTRAFARRNAVAGTEDRGLMRFNNALAALMLGLAQLFFLLRVPLAGWILALMVALAAGIALAGFCIGCFLFLRFKLARYQLFGN